MTTHVKAFSGAFALALIPFISAKAAVTYTDGQDWIGAGDDTLFSTSANWQNGREATSTAAARFNGQAGKTVTFDSAYSIADYVWVGEWGDDASADYNLYVSADGATVKPLTFTASESTYGFTAKGNLSLADSASQTGALTVDSGSYSAANGYWGWGAGAKLVANIAGGAVAYTGDIYMMWGGNVTNIVNVKSGSLSATGKILAGTNSADSKTTVNVGDPDGAGTTAALTCGTLELGEYGCSGMTSIVNLNAGGTLTTASVAPGTDVTGDPSLVLAFNGGTLKAAAAGTLIGSGLTVTVDKTNGGTINTDGKAITVSSAIGGSGTLTLTGGGSVTFTVNPTCGISIDSESAPEVTYPTVTTGTYYWVGGAVGENARLAFSATAGKWSATKGGEAIADFVPGEGDTAVFTTAGVNIYADSVAADIKAMVDVNFYNHNTKTDTTISGDIYIDSGVTFSAKAIKGRGLTLTGAIAGSGTLNTFTTVQGSNVNLNGDMSAFTGTANLVADETSSSPLIPTRINTANNALSAWNVYVAEDSMAPYRASDRAGYTAFNLNNTTYSFGSLNAVVSYPDINPYGSTFVIGGRDTEDSSMYGRFQGAGNAIIWSAPTTFTYGVTNAASFTVTGGGTVKFVDPGALPAAFTVSGDGAYIGMTTDSDVNAAGVAAITSIASGATIGFDADDTENECAVNISSASILEGQTLVKKGAGVLYMSGITYANDIVVNEGTLVLAHGSVVGDVTVASGASLLVDLSGAADAEEVFTYTSISGDGTVSYRNMSDRATVTTDASPWVLTMTGEAITYTWSGLGDDNDWSNVANWYANGVDATELPTAGDTVNIDREGVVILSAPEEIAANVVVKSGYTLTISSGFVFSSLTVEEGGYIAFNDAITAVGDSKTLTATIADFDTSNFAKASNENYDVSLSNGVLTATRIAATYTWTGAVDTNWATSGNWTVGETAVAEVPATADSVIFPASDAEDFTGWSVALAADVSVQGVAVNGNVALSGGKTIWTLAISGSAELQLNTANIGTLGAALTVSCPVNVLADTTDYIYLAGYNAQLDGALIGSGTLISDSGNVQNIGVTFNGDVSEFAGKFQSTNYSNRDHTNFGSGVYGSTNAVWEISPSDNKDYNSYVINSSTDTYMFGALIGNCWAGDYYGKVQIGGRDDVDSSVTLYSHTTSQGDPRAYTITKIGNSTLTINNTHDSEKLDTLYLNGGTAVLGCYPTSTLTFGGGIVKTPAYTTTVDDVETTVYPDVSSKITGSTGPIAFTNDEGEEHTWAALDSTSNTGGLSKYGSGKLTITTKMGYEGITSVFDDGILEIDTALNKTFDADCPVNALSTGTITGAAVTAYAYPAGTTLYGTEEADDYLKVLNNNSSEALVADLDFSGVTTVDVSAQDLYDEENNKLKNFVLARTTGAITGIGKVGNGLTLIVPECPDGVAEGKWVWTVRTTVETVDNVTYHCVTVTPKALPFVISIQ